MTIGYFWNNENPNERYAGRLLEKRVEEGTTYYVDHQSTYWENFKENKLAEKEFFSKIG